MINKSVPVGELLRHYLFRALGHFESSVIEVEVPIPFGAVHEGVVRSDLGFEGGKHIHMTGNFKQVISQAADIIDEIAPPESVDCAIIRIDITRKIALHLKDGINNRGILPESPGQRSNGREGFIQPVFLAAGRLKHDIEAQKMTPPFNRDSISASSFPVAGIPSRWTEATSLYPEIALMVTLIYAG